MYDRQWGHSPVMKSIVLEPWTAPGLAEALGGMRPLLLPVMAPFNNNNN